MTAHGYNEDRLRASLARVASTEGQTLGTAFVLLPGLVLTCHHVVGSRRTVKLHFSDRSSVDGLVDDGERFPLVDAALVRFEHANPQPFPAEARHDGVREVRSLGYHYGVYGILGPFPFDGRISGIAGGLRYRHDRDYVIECALRIKDDFFDVGMSGAPLVDAATGVAVGLINAKLSIPGQTGGFAVPFEGLANSAPTLSDLLVANRRAVPRYGRFLNHLGAVEVCRTITERSLEWLASLGLFQPEHYARRRTAESLLDDFLASEPPILALVGEPGVGKTQVMAMRAQAMKDRATLLLVVRKLGSTAHDLPSAVDQAIVEALGPIADPVGLAKAIEEQGGQLLMLVDGLNELPDAGIKPLPFLDSCVSWSETSRARLVLSTRPEFWRVARSRIPPRLIFEPQGAARTGSSGEGQVRNIGDFTPDEEREARQRHNLPPVTIRLSHPLLMRIFSEIGADAKKGPLFRVDAYEHFLDLKCGAIASRTGEHSTLIRDRLEGLACTAFERGGFAVPGERFAALCGSGNVASATLDERLLVRTEAGYRFAFDEIGEYLSAITLRDPAALVEQVVGARPERSAVLAFWLLHQTAKGDRGRAQEIFEMLMRAAASADAAGRYAATSVIQMVLPEATDVAPFLEADGVDPDQVADALRILAMDREKLAQDFARAVQLGSWLLEHVSSSNRSDVGWFIEGMLYAVRSPSMASQVLPFVDRLVAIGGVGARRCLAYFCRLPDPETNVAGLRHDVIARLITAEDDVDNLKLIVEGLLTELGDEAEASSPKRARAELDRLERRLAQDDFEELALAAAIVPIADERPTRGVLRLFSEPRRSLGFRAMLFLERARKGEELWRAALDARQAQLVRTQSV